MYVNLLTQKFQKLFNFCSSSYYIVILRILQEEKYRMPPENVPKFIGEDIADNGGLRAAYRGMVEFRESIRARFGPESTFENLKFEGLEEYTDEQLFFITYTFVRQIYFPLRNHFWSILPISLQYAPRLKKLSNYVLNEYFLIQNVSQFRF